MYKILKISIFYLLFLVFTGCNLSTPISPGELARVHEQYEGAQNCTKCHSLGKRISDNKCLDCHKSINSRIASGQGYHSSSEVKNKSCVKCHSDHHGKDFEITHFDTAQFEHKLTGYELEGTHKDLTCSNCHHKGLIKDTAVIDRPGTYLGLGSACIDCHRDYHQGELGRNCGDCHDLKRFVPATRFDHHNTNFKLNGEHRNVDCYACHIKETEGTEIKRMFTGLKYDNCYHCHDDIHKGKLGNDCAYCHSEASFHQINRNAEFDHSLTGYPLKGKHASVACEACHGSSFNPEPSSNSCLDCHEDYHEGAFKVNAVVRDCADCHTLDGFEYSTYTVQQHNRSGFPLTGFHENVSCVDCHKKGSEWKFRKIGMVCADCHTNVHEGYIEKSYFKNGCKDCHSTAGWSNISFNHNSTGYNLEGKHNTLTCRACHFESHSGIEGQKFQSIDRQCIQCHDDIHNTQFEVRGKTECLRCHGYQDWSASKFNHDNTEFPLDGKHQDVACTKCHIEKQEGSISYYQYKLESFKCADCH